MGDLVGASVGDAVGASLTSVIQASFLESRKLLMDVELKYLLLLPFDGYII